MVGGKLLTKTIAIDWYVGWHSWGLGVQFTRSKWTRIADGQVSWTLTVRFLPFSFGVLWNVPDMMYKEWGYK